ncbi:MAG: sigma-70 family RNA polymerase sigma factor [Bryobacteraceae bacterium]
MSPSGPNVTQLLVAWREGDKLAMDQLMPLVYEQLQGLARHHLSGERPGYTLPATALVHEAYLKLVGADIAWQDRGHFFAVAAKTMRRILVDRAKSRRSARRGGVNPHFSIEEIAVVSEQPPAQIVQLDDALLRLEAIDQRKSRIIDLIFFAGLSQEETAAALDISPATVFRDLSFAKAWLARELASSDP